MSYSQRGKSVEVRFRPRLRLAVSLLLGAGAWASLSSPLLLGHRGYGELNYARTTLLALATLMLPWLQHRLRPEVEAGSRIGFITALWPTMSSWSGVVGTFLILSGWGAAYLGARWASGWMGEDLGAIGATIIFILVNAFAGLGSLVLLIRDLKWAKRTAAERLLSLGHLAFCGVGCWLFLT